MPRSAFRMSDIEHLFGPSILSVCMCLPVIQPSTRRARLGSTSRGRTTVDFCSRRDLGEGTKEATTHLSSTVDPIGCCEFFTLALEFRQESIGEVSLGTMEVYVSSSAARGERLSHTQQFGRCQ